MFDLHRHDQFSLFDGFGKATENAKQAKLLGYTALGLANHGNVSGLVQHHFACQDVGIKPILGVEMYFQPVWDKEKPRYHLCVFAKDLGGYRNLNKLMRIGEEQMYYKPIVTFKDLAKHREGLIVSSACIAGFIPRMLSDGKEKLAYKAANKFKDIFKDDFYLELQPYEISIPNMQEEVNVKLAKMSEKLGIKCILTSDSHYAKKEDWETYLKMHEISSPEFDAEATYGERYMPSGEEMRKRFLDMHSSSPFKIPNPNKFVDKCFDNLKEIEDKCEADILGQLELKLPVFVEGKDSFSHLVKGVQEGLRKRGKYKKDYIERCKEELSVIKANGFAEYFLIVSDYVNWAKEENIVVGPGRGSVCNSLVSYALGITEVDSLKFNLDFRRFLRLDKQSLPDIDLDFETGRREEVIEYIISKYEGHTAQIRSYGLYKVDNLLNDLVKVCGVDNDGEVAKIKAIVRNHTKDGDLDEESLRKDRMFREFNTLYDNILIHFIKMFKKVRYLGTHAAGVAVSGGDIEDYVALKPDKKTGKIYTAFDLQDLENINVIKFDILGLSTMQQIGELRKLTGKSIQEDWLKDENVLANFREGNTDGIFQFERDTAKQILRSIQCDCFDDIVAASSMNRPGPLSLGQHIEYASNKANPDDIKGSKYYEFTKESYGTIIYQEQILQICVNIGGFEWHEADKVVKMEKGGLGSSAVMYEENHKKLLDKFIRNAKKKNIDEREAADIFEAMMVYSFNKGHSTGYSIISVEEMYYKTYYPIEYWYVKCKYAANDNDLFKYKANAVKEGAILFLPHVNYSSDWSLRKMDGEWIIQEGLRAIKGIGEKAAAVIEEERERGGVFTSFDDFYDRCQSRAVHKGVVDKLKGSGALDFDRSLYIHKVTKYNSAWYTRAFG